MLWVVRMYRVCVLLVISLAGIGLTGCGGGDLTPADPVSSPTPDSVRQGTEAILKDLDRRSDADAARLRRAIDTGDRGAAATFQILSGGMTPAIRPGDRVLGVTPAGADDLGRGDVVIFAPTDAQRAVCAAPRNAKYVKRVVGLPGERVVVPAGTPDVIVDGRRFTVAGAGSNPASDGPSSRTFDIPAGKYLVLGDNRLESCDSLQWTNDPFVAFANITLRVLGIYSPAERAGALPAR